MKKLERLTSIIESVVFLSGTPIAIKDLMEKLDVSEGMVMDSVKKLQEKYDKQSGLQLMVFNKKLQFSTNPEYAEEVFGVLNPIKEKELSRSLLEVAAIIAYKQPVTRVDLEEIRGNSEYAVQKLLELKMIEPVGRKETIGKPVLFGTTDEFLKRFEIGSLDELPDYNELLRKIKEMHSDREEGEYLYKKPELSEEVAVTVPAEEPPKEEDMLPFDEEEIPDFLQGEDVSTYTGE